MAERLGRRESGIAAALAAVTTTLFGGAQAAAKPAGRDDTSPVQAPPSQEELEARVVRLVVPQLTKSAGSGAAPTLTATPTPDPTPGPPFPGPTEEEIVVTPPADQNTQVQGPVALRSEEPLIVNATPYDAYGRVVHGVGARWSSSDRNVVFVTPDGQALAGRPGAALLTATLNNIEAAVSVVVLATSDDYGGRKQDSTRAVSIPVARKREAAGGARFVKAAWSPDEGSPFRPSRRARELAGRSSLSASPAAAPFLTPYDERERLPDDETDSLYEPRNDVGRPPGQTEPGATTPPAATPSGTETPGSDNFTFGVPLVGLPGRQLDVSLALTYNSRLWHKSSDTEGRSHMTYDVDAGWPAPGFRLGYGFMEAQASRGFTLVSPDGSRHQMVAVGADAYETTDGTFIRYVGGQGWGNVTFTDGTRILYKAADGTPRLYPVMVTDRNGNFITIDYVGERGPRISTIKDTMKRYVKFHYEGDSLIAVTVPGYDGGPDRQTVRFYYEELPITGAFVGHERHAPPTARVLRHLYFPGTRSGFRYDYSAYGMIYRTSQLREMTVSTADERTAGAVVSEGQTAATSEYDYPVLPGALDDAPAYTRRADQWVRQMSGTQAVHRGSVHTFSVDQAGGVSTVTAPDGTQTVTSTVVNPGQWDDGLVRETVVRQGARTYSRTVITWEHDGSFNNHRPQRVEVTDERSETRGIHYGYGAFNNVTALSERGFAGEELRRTETAYEARAQWVNRRLVRLPTSVKVYDGPTNRLKSFTEYAYDTTPGTGLTKRPGIEMHDSSFNPDAPAEEKCRWERDPANIDDGLCPVGMLNCDGRRGRRYVCGPVSPYLPETDYRGNLTRVTAHPRATQPTTAAAVVYGYSYDIAGNLVRETADCCQQRAYAYEKASEYAYPTAVASGDAGQLEVKTAYDRHTGLVRSVIDENGQTTSIAYYPESLRHRSTTRPDGAYTESEYGDGAVSFVKMKALIDPQAEIILRERQLEGLRIFSGNGDLRREATRTAQTPLVEGGPEEWAAVDYDYDALRRLTDVSNPFYTDAPFDTAGLRPRATVYSYDGLGRQKMVLTADNSIASADFSGRVTTLTDAAGRQRRSLMDALGRLERVDEPAGEGDLGPVESPAQATHYAYDALDNLVKVVQGTQQRRWRYDSMGRLTHERQVEQDAPIAAPDPAEDDVTNWSRRFEYTKLSQVSLTVDARGVQTTLVYDGLNRLRTASYTDGTPPVTYVYDEARAGFFNRGRLTRVETAANAGAPATAQEFDYDLVGRVSKNRQLIDGGVYGMAYTYNGLDQLKEQTYPSGRVVVHRYDLGARLTSVTDRAGRTYASGISYAPHGGVTSETYGNGAVREMDYNSRLQPSAITLTKGNSVIQQYRYAYGRVDSGTGAVDATKNTGQIGRAEAYAGGTAPAHKQNEQRYTYDALGRLDLAAEHRAGDNALAWRADYAYDRYGNRLQSAQAGHQNHGLLYNAVEAADVDAATNRFKPGMSLEYDASGNVRTDARFRGLKYEYDAQGMMRRTTNLDGGAETKSVYDGLGQRVRQTAGGETRHFVYDIAGQIVAEYGPLGWERDRVYRGGQLLATDEAVGTCRKTVEQFVEAFFRGSLDRPPTPAESQAWAGRLRDARSGGPAALLSEAQALGRALFESAEYAARGRADGEFVNDLYWAYLQRASDADGYLHWLEYTRVNGRPATVTAFGVSIEFSKNVEGLCSDEEVTGELHWVFTDHVGSVRVITDSQGAVIGRRDNLPFGDALRDVGDAEASAPQGGTAMSASSAVTTSGLWTWHNSVRPIFAGMERDVPTGLEHTQFRKYESGFGRWTSPDPYPGSMSVGDPQSFNRYAYVQNDPVNFVDPDGLNLCSAEFSYAQCGGDDGFWGGEFGGHVGEYNVIYGGIPPELVERLRRHEERISNSIGGNGFRTNEEIAAAESFSMRYWVYPDGTVVIEPFRLSPVEVYAGLRWHERGRWGAAGDWSRGVINSVSGGLIDRVEVWGGRITEEEVEGYRHNRAHQAGQGHGDVYLVLATRGRNKVGPVPGAVGPHSALKFGPGGNITGYSTFRVNPRNPTGFDLFKRFDLTGDTHNGVPTPHVHGPRIPGGVRPARANEMPR